MEYVVKFRNSVSDIKGMIAVMEYDDNDKTSPEWIAYYDHLHHLENSMNPMENLLVTIMVVDGATCDLAKLLQSEVVFIQMVITFLLNLVGSTGDPMENLPTWTMDNEGACRRHCETSGTYVKSPPSKPQTP